MKELKVNNGSNLLVPPKQPVFEFLLPSFSRPEDIYHCFTAITLHFGDHVLFISFTLNVHTTASLTIVLPFSAWIKGY